MPPRILAAGAAGLCAVLLSSCGPRPVGYGVVLWGETTGTPKTGAVVPVVQQAALGSPDLISVRGARTLREYPSGRIRFFMRKAEATAYAASYASEVSAWAVVVKEDAPPLPMREEPSADARVVYKLSYGQLVKVVSRGDRQVLIKPYTDYWYELATEDGFVGWCFGHFLKTFRADMDPSGEARRLLTQDDVLARIMSTTWRPAWFQDMVDRGAIDLTMFRDDVGLFPEPALKVIRLVLPRSTYEFHYMGDPQKAGAASYTFAGADLRVDALGHDRITVSYHAKGQLKTELYIAMTADVDQIITEEQKRRSDLYDALVARGATLSSDAYGTIHLAPGMHFSWEGYGKLVPALIPPQAKGKGTVDFTLHMAKELSPQFDGVVTFVFDEAPDAGVSFLTRSLPGGLRFTSLAKDSVQDLFVTHPSLTPVVIFFRQSP